MGIPELPERLNRKIYALLYMHRHHANRNLVPSRMKISLCKIYSPSVNFRLLMEVNRIHKLIIRYYLIDNMSVTV